MATNSGAVEPHCGICQHSSFDDAHEVPFCSKWDEPTSIRVGTVCSAFDPEAEMADAVESEARTIDRPAADDRSGGSGRVPGSGGPFYEVYDGDGETKFGWFCGNCSTLDVAMDTMGTISCTRCGNRRKPKDWDAAYL